MIKKSRFKWTSFTNPEEEACTSKDSDVDQVSFLVAVSLWLIEHAHLVIFILFNYCFGSFAYDPENNSQIPYTRYRIAIGTD